MLSAPRVLAIPAENNMGQNSLDWHALTLVSSVEPNMVAEPVCHIVGSALKLLSTQLLPQLVHLNEQTQAGNIPHIETSVFQL